MAVIHISEADAIRDFASLAAHVRAGDEVLIDSETTSMVLKATSPKTRTTAETIALLEQHERELGYAPVMDADFAADVEERIRNRKPADRTAWD